MKKKKKKKIPLVHDPSFEEVDVFHKAS